MNDQDRKHLARMNLRQREVARKSLKGSEPEHDPARDIEELKRLSESYGVPGIDLNQVCIRLEDLELLPREIAERRLILPVLVREDRVFVAMTDPGDKKVIDELEFVTGKRLFPYCALATALTRVIEAAYTAKRRGEQFYIGPDCPPEIQEKMGVFDRPSQVPVPRASAFPQGPTASFSDPVTEKVAEENELSYTELGDMNPDLSVVAQLPTGPGGMPAVPPTPGAAPLKNRGKVLIVDDEADIRKLMGRFLAGRGFETLEADRGFEALRMVKAHMPELIILDAMLPEVHGFDIARRIKNSRKYGHIPILMVSAVYKGWRFAEDAKKSYGVDAYVEKPFRISDLLKTVDEVMEQAEARKAALPPPTQTPPSPEASRGGQVTAQAQPAPQAGRPNRAPTGQKPVRAPSAPRSETAEKCLHAGVAAYKAGDVETAIKHLRRGVEIDPLAYRLHFNLGLLYGKQGRVYEAIRELEQAIEQNDRHFPAVKNLAVLYQKAGFRHKAVEAWEKALRVAPDEATKESIKKHLLRLL